jgi:myosin heavy subunit
METLSKTESLYIRCIKPNSVKKADLFDAHMCDEQLRYSGVFEAVKIRQQGYPIRLLHRRFYMRYRACATAEERGVLDHQLGTDRDRAEYLVG